MRPHHPARAAWRRANSEIKRAAPRACTANCGASALLAPGELSRLLQGDAFRERIRMSVHELPAGPAPAKDLRDAQGPVLLRQAADFGAHPFDRHENDQI